jgi:hypothetical protein
MYTTSTTNPCRPVVMTYKKLKKKKKKDKLLLHHQGMFNTFFHLSLL